MEFMKKKHLLKLYQELKQQGISPEMDFRMRLELDHEGDHDVEEPARGVGGPFMPPQDDRFYDFDDLAVLQGLHRIQPPYVTSLSSIDELLERDRQRETDGFPRKIRVGRLVKPGKGKKDKVVVVPTTVEEKLIHDRLPESTEEEQTAGGSGEGEEGEVIGEQPVRVPGQEGAGEAGEGGVGKHEIESSAYDLGKILTEKFELPNLKDKGKKRSFTRYTYEMTDRNRGFGQILDKKATLKRILETNINLGNIPDLYRIDSTHFLISPSDLVYRVLSPERDYQSQAMVFFIRDYSGSMSGKCTELVVTQHVLIYSWLLYQYSQQVESRFILHDTDAQEVPDFYTYYNSKVAGGTKVVSGYRLVNEIVEKDRLDMDYNIYIFHGTDGDDWDTYGKETVPELKKMLAYANRIGITIAEHSYLGESRTEVEKYLIRSGLLEEKPNLLRLDIIREDADEPRLIDGIKRLIS